MIEAFVSSWALFHQGYLTGWLISLVLSLIGVFVVARDQIFIGAAISQASMLGIAIALWVAALVPEHRLPWVHSGLFPSVMAVGFSILAASVTSRGGDAGRESHEAITGWVFLLSASLSVLIVSRSPHGLEEIHRVLSSSIIGATMGDVWVFFLLAGLSALFLVLFYRKILLFAFDPSMSTAIGLKTGAWSLATSAWLGLAIGLSIRASGMLYTFGCLVLPALVAKNLSREVRRMFVLAPVLAAASSVAGFFLANRYDYPPGQLTVALFCLELVGVWFLKWLKGRRSR